MNFNTEDLGTLEFRGNRKQESRMWPFLSEKRKTKWIKYRSQLENKNIMY